MTKDIKPRKTTLEERIRIVEYCIANPVDRLIAFCLVESEKQIAG